jgi:hypothetical protein
MQGIGNAVATVAEADLFPNERRLRSGNRKEEGKA